MYIITSYMDDVRLSHLNKDYLLTYLLTYIFANIRYCICSKIWDFRKFQIAGMTFPLTVTYDFLLVFHCNFVFKVVKMDILLLVR